MCPRANPIQILLVIVKSLLDIVIIRAPIIHEYWIFDLLWPIIHILHHKYRYQFNSIINLIILMKIYVLTMYSHILDVVTMNLVIYIGYSDILDIVII